jgi:hypothetical protein
MERSPDWVQEEDRQLLDYGRLVDEGVMSWEEVAQEFPGRTAKACSSRHYRLKTGRVDAELATTAKADNLPTSQQLFVFMNNHPRTLRELTDHFGVSPKIIEAKIEKMIEYGYMIVRTKSTTAVETHVRPKMETPETNIADLLGKEFTLGVASDIHHGGRFSQPTSYNRFVKYAYEHYGVRNMFGPGDKFTGIFGYSGHENDMVLPAIPRNRAEAWRAIDAQIKIADICTPRYEDLTYWEIGGNHDRWMIRKAGIDGLRMLCDSRDDMVYCGYHVAGIPLTPQSHVRMWHPSGGVAYAKSYRIQKGMEGLAIEALKEAMREEMPPITSLLLVGHLHQLCYLPEPPLYGMLCGSFEGQTGYLKEKGLTPQIAGIILTVKLDNKGRPYQVGYDPVSFEEIDDDWKNWPLPEEKGIDLTPDTFNTVFEATAEPAT